MKRMPSAIAFLVATLAIALLGGGVGVAVSADREHRVQVLTFNVLAPIWAGAVWYPADMDGSLLNREYRRAVSADVRLTHCVEVKVTHLGEDGGFAGRRHVDPGASSGDSDIGPARGVDPTDQSADGTVAEHGSAVFAG